MRLETPEKIRTLQRKLYCKAKAEPAFRFYLLYDKICRADILDHAYRLARANAGAPGVDGVTFAQIEAESVDAWLASLREELDLKTYRSAPVRQVMIPKPGGGDKGRQAQSSKAEAPLSASRAGWPRRKNGWIRQLLTRRHSTCMCTIAFRGFGLRTTPTCWTAYIRRAGINKDSSPPYIRWSVANRRDDRPSHRFGAVVCLAAAFGHGQRHERRGVGKHHIAHHEVVAFTCTENITQFRRFQRRQHADQVLSKTCS